MYLDLEIEKMVSRIGDINPDDVSDSFLKRKSEGIIAYINKYEQITGAWPHISARKENFKGHKGNIYYLSPVGLKIILGSIGIWDESKASTSLLLSKDDVTFIRRNLGAIKNLMEDSEKYTYSMAEVQEMLKEQK